MSRINIFDGVPAEPIIFVNESQESEDNSRESDSSGESGSIGESESSSSEEFTDFEEQYFWGVIHSLTWHNLSDAQMNPDAITRILRQIPQRQKNGFLRCYHVLFRELLEIVTDADLFSRYGIVDPSEKERIISHMIAMGKKQYRTVCSDVSFFEYFIEANECQPFDIFVKILM